MIDTHAHVYAEAFDSDRDAMLEQAFRQGVDKIFMPNVDDRTLTGMMALESQYPDRCFAMMGLHPCSVGHDVEKQLQTVQTWLNTRPFAAVGEIGLDFYWSLEFVKQQEIAFAIQITWAKQHKLPVVLHCRNSLDRTLELLEPMLETDGPKGIFHCFSGTRQQAEKVVELGFLLGIGGVATFKNGGLDQVLPHISLQHLVLETDSPYLAPVPHRGTRNQPAYLSLIATRIADLKGVDFKTVARQTTENAEKLFNVL